MTQRPHATDQTGTERTEAGTGLLAQAKIRLVLVAAVFMLGYLAIGLRLVDLTLLRDAPQSPTAAIHTESAENAAPERRALRGTITDRNGELLATSLRMASLYADATLIDDPAGVARQLAGILTGHTKEDLQRKLSSGRKFVWIERNITPRQEYAINALGQPGLGFQESGKRIYPHGRLTAHIVGYTDVDARGISGVEKFHDRQLATGDDTLRLSVDIRIQHLLHRELADAMKKFSAAAAVGAVMDVNTGEIIAMVSLPDFDPYNPAAASDSAKFNRASLGVFEMGSTVKLFSVAGALDSGEMSFGTVFDASESLKTGRFSISDYHGKKRLMTLVEAFIHSSNIGTAKMAQAMGEQGLREFYRTLGFFEPVPVDLPERGSPLYPRNWREVHTLTASYGHGFSISPLHMIRATAAIANGGVLVKPVLTLRGDRPQTRDAFAQVTKPQGPRVIRPQTSANMRKLMELVVTAGTGGKAAVEGYNVGGKTGTAEKTQAGGYSRNNLLSSFVGVFPVHQPRYAVLAMLDEPKATADTHGFATGGWTAAPVVAKVVEQMGPLYQIPPDFDLKSTVLRDMSPYLKEDKEGKSLATAGIDR